MFTKAYAKGAGVMSDAVVPDGAMLQAKPRLQTARIQAI